MLNKLPLKQTLVAILLTGAPGRADPPAPPEPPEPPGVYRDWRLDCAADQCRIATTVAGADGSAVLTLAVAAGAAALTVTTSLPLFLPDGLTLALGGRPEIRAPWRTCGVAGCESSLPLAPDLLGALRQDRGGSAGLTLESGVEVRVPFSLLGFSAALAAERAAKP